MAANEKYGAERMSDMTAIISNMLIAKNIAFSTVEHSPVFTMEVVERQLHFPHNAKVKTLVALIKTGGMLFAVSAQMPG